MGGSPAAVAPLPAAAPVTARTPRPRVGIVSFLNTLPLVYGLEKLTGLDCRPSVPSLLVGRLLAGEVDIALCSSIDYQRAPEPLVTVPVGMLGCDGPTLTVRLYAKTPLHRVERVFCDTDSHTSITLMRIMLRERYGTRPEIVDYDAREHMAQNRPVDGPEAILLIGDKVVTDAPPAGRYPHQLDLGAAWADETRLPFVFAIWLARRTPDGAGVRLAAAVLDRQRRYNRQRLDTIIHRCAPPRRWPKHLAARYLKHNLRYVFTDRSREGLTLFYEKALAHGFIREVRPVEVFR